MKKYKSASYGEILSIALPLVVSTGCWTLMHFTDRLFLSWYSRDALAAALPAGITAFTCVCFFIGVASYISTFVAQYYGAGQYQNIGSIVWQGAFFALISGVLLLPLIPFSKPLFDFIGHPDNIPQLEATYFRILCYSMSFQLLSSVFSSFFIGMGKNRVVMKVNLFAAGFNIVLDYAWIFGKWGLPAWGLRGAAWATTFSSVLAAAIFFILFLQPKYQEQFHTLKGFAFSPKLFIRLLRFGLPSGLQFLIDMTCFSLFILLVGKLGTTELTATNIAFNINVLAFMPMIGFSIATSTLVGQYLGKNNPELASRCVVKVFKITLLYMGLISLSYIVFPGFYVRLYGSREEQHLMEEIYKMSRYLLLFVAFYSFFDAVNLVYCSAIKGAGDTRFVMMVVLFLSIIVVVIPTYICCVVFEGSIYIAWAFVTFYIVILSFVFIWRYKSGKWKTMRVIDMRIPEVIPTSGALSESEITR